MLRKVKTINKDSLIQALSQSTKRKLWVILIIDIVDNFINLSFPHKMHNYAIHIIITYATYIHTSTHKPV